MTQTRIAHVHVHDRAADQPYGSLGEFANEVRRAEVSPHDIPVRLRTQNTQSGPDGGFAVPSPLLDSLHNDVLAQSVLYARVSRRTVVQGNEYQGVLPDESARTDGARHGGLTLPRVAEMGTYAYSLPQVRQVRMNLVKRGTIVPATNELVEDSPAFGADLEAIVAYELAFLLDRMIWAGAGGADPIGMANAASAITVAIEGTQNIANTLDFIRVNAAKLLRSIRRIDRAVFVLHPDLLVDVLTATAGGVANGAAPIIGPATPDAPFGTLHNRPMFPLEVAPAVGTVGDFGCVDPSRYVVASKGAVTSAVSIHARFLQDESLFRFSVRFNGQPMLSGPVTPFSGSAPKSDIAILGARA